MSREARQLRFLVVDDNEDIRDVFCRLVERAGHEAATAVTWATSLRDAGGIDGYSLAPATLEDAYLGLTAQEDDDAEPTSRQEPAHV